MPTIIKPLIRLIIKSVMYDKAVFASQENTVVLQNGNGILAKCDYQLKMGQKMLKSVRYWSWKLPRVLPLFAQALAIKLKIKVFYARKTKKLILKKSG